MRHTHISIHNFYFSDRCWLICTVLVGCVIYGGHKLYKLVVSAVIHLVLSEYSKRRARE